MPVTVVRLHLVAPGAGPAALSARYRAAYADEHGISTARTEEHPGADDHWLPSPFAFAGAVFGVTRRIAVTVSAVVGPPHDPLPTAGAIAVLDLLSGGRLVTVAGIGYRLQEYALFGVDWHRRGRRWRAEPGRPAVRHRRPRSGQWPGRGRRTVRGEGSGDLALLPEFGGPRYEAQPISSRDLPFVSLTNFRTNGMESAANTV